MLKIYNTLSREKEEFVPIHGNRVNMFVCGLSPYDYAHLGHAKTYVNYDVIARYLRFKGYRVFYLQNVTDVEDRIIKRANETGRETKDLVKEFFEEYLKNMEALNVTGVSFYAWATDYCTAPSSRRTRAKGTRQTSRYGRPGRKASLPGTARGARVDPAGTSRTLR
jgi:cysteinyl-tRNA synthetase